MAGARLSVTDFLLLAIMSLALLAIGVWLIDRVLHDAPVLPSGPPNLVAVLAFEATEEESGPLAIDLTERLISEHVAQSLGITVSGADRRAISGDGIGLRKARVHTLQREIGQAIDAVQAAYDGGFRCVYDVIGSLPVPLERLVGTPRFDDLLQRFEADLAAMRERTVALLPAE